MRQWEYQYLQANTLDVDGLRTEAVRLGAEGWEMVGVTSVDKTLGLNSNLLWFKRELPSPPRPDTDEEWQPDPTGRFDKRRWDGTVWTAEVTSALTDRRFIVPPRIDPHR